MGRTGAETDRVQSWCSQARGCARYEPRRGALARRVVQAVVLRGGVLLGSLVLAPVWAQDEADEAATQQAQLMERSCGEQAGGQPNWLDRSHSYVNERLCEPAAWFDGFFGDPRSLEETPVGTFFRIRNDVQWDQHDGWSHGLRVRANLLLPRVSDRLRLLVSRDEDVSGELRDSPAIGSEQDNRTRLGLRFIASERARSQLDIDGSVHVGSGELNPELRARYRYLRGLSDDTLARATQVGFWQREDGFGSTTRLDFEWLPSRDQLLRWTGEGTVSEASDGVDWRSALVAFRQLDRRSALRTEVGAFGYTQPRFETEEYFIAVRYRRQFLRHWLYYELQPEHAWPRDELSGQRRSDWRFTLTLEVQFENETSRQHRAEDYLGEDADAEAWAEDLPVPLDAPGDRAFDPVLEAPEDTDGSAAEDEPATENESVPE